MTTNKLKFLKRVGSLWKILIESNSMKEILDFEEQIIKPKTISVDYRIVEFDNIIAIGVHNHNDSGAGILWNWRNDK